MELLDQQIILNIKSRFFDIVDVEDGQIQFENALLDMLTTIKMLMSAEEVTFYRYDEWKQQFYVEVSTNFKMTINKVQAKNSFQELKESFMLHKFFRKPIIIAPFNRYDLLIPIKNKGKFLGALSLVEGCEPFSKFSEETIGELGDECGSFFYKTQQLVNIVKEEKRYKQLFRVTEKFHSSMNKESVLEEIIYTLQEVYPTYTYYLYLSQDHKGYDGLPIKNLDYDVENNAIMQSYVTGTTQFEDSPADKRSILYTPLKGKQGIYGVLQVIAPNTIVFPNDEVEFITLLANTAGSAIENAQLYEQSKQLISDLQLINEISQHLNSNHRLSETMKYMTEQIKKSFLAVEVGFILFSSDYTKIIVQPGSTNFFFSRDAESYIDYFKKKMLFDNESLFIGDLYLPGGNHILIPYKSVMAVPMVQSDVLKGFALALHPESYYFSFDTFNLFRSLIHHSTLAFTNTLLREELEKMVVTDHLTKLYSRNYLDEKIKESMKKESGGTFIIIDIDNFKSINDTFGHQVGDEVIIQVAKIILANIRGTDIGARWGGEELAIYLPGVPLETGIQIAERLVAKVRESSRPSITISCGVSYWKKGEPDCYTALFKRADQALYCAKWTGKNKVVISETN